MGVDDLCAVAVFARSAILGKAKSRLIPSLGERGALTVHCILVERTLRQLETIEVGRKTLWVTEIDACSQRWATDHDFELLPQYAGDLGQKMAATIRCLLDEGSSRVCLVGSDCPPIDAAYVEGAFRQLENHDLVLGPAEDGGYGLIAIRDNFPAAIFQSIEWGTGEVLQQTISCSKECGMSSYLLDEIWDVDTPQDWQRFTKT
ncbi:MAG: glycosyltransferase [Gammaproteobacteria bacterium]|nr:glycosyltransferase [Gammaproteobacteria bacterium]